MGTHAREKHPRVLALILAGGKGERLMPLTQVRSKPAVPGMKARRMPFTKTSI